MLRKVILPVLALAAAGAACSPVPRTITPPASGPSQTPALPTIVTDTPVGVTDTPIPPPALPVIASPALLQIDFQSSSNGWALADGAILRTVDGGGTWFDATPDGLTGIGYSTDIFVLDDNHVWVQVPNADFYTGRLYRSSDGGLTWSSFPVPFGGADIQFLDADTGRLLADRGAGAGSNAVELYQSGDGGASWTSVFHNDPSQPGWSEALPLGGIKNGMIFLDGSTGWVTGTRPVDGGVYLYLTRDGGVSWSQQSIPLPAGYESYQFLPQPPIFFGAEGFLPLNISVPGGGYWQTFYVTHDGGSTWSGDPSDGDRIVSDPGRYSFADPLHGWAWDGGSVFHLTSDGSQTWDGMAAPLILTGGLSQLEFARGPGSGFTGWALTAVDDSGRAQLYRTDDNGVNWTPLLP